LLAFLTVFKHSRFFNGRVSFAREDATLYLWALRRNGNVRCGVPPVVVHRPAGECGR